MKTIAFVLACLLWPLTAYPLEAVLMWNPNTEPELAGYHVYQAERIADKTGPWTRIKTVPAPETKVTITLEQPGNYAWYITAYDNDGNETQASNMVELGKSTTLAEPTGLTKD